MEINELIKSITYIKGKLYTGAPLYIIPSDYEFQIYLRNNLIWSWDKDEVNTFEKFKELFDEWLESRGDISERD